MNRGLPPAPDQAHSKGITVAAIYPQKIGRAQVPANDNLCMYCTAKCCRYFALPIDAPTSRKEFDYIRWYLLHEAATVFTEDETWYLLVHTSCKHLQDDHRCGIYETRPQICREYTTDNCEYDDSWVYDHYFETPEQIDEYVETVYPSKKRKSIRSLQPALLPIVG